MAGERERGGGAPEKEGGAARGSGLKLPKLRKIFALHICKNCEQLHPLVSLLLSDEFDFGFGSIASIWSYEIHSDINLSFLITMNMLKQLSDLTDEKDCYWYQMQRWNCAGKLI
ncbi:hypothetical protein QL285_002287 [Trifolium repens]|nr:hypothetical protein QL285_002287 [Trifolium repens]